MTIKTLHKTAAVIEPKNDSAAADAAGASFDRRLAYSVEGFAAATSLGRTVIFELIRAGALTARKCGSRTLILQSDAIEFLAALPEIGLDRRAKTKVLGHALLDVENAHD